MKTAESQEGDKDDGGPRRRSRASGSKKFLSPIPLSALRPPRTSCPIFILVFGLHPRSSSGEETFLMNVRCLKGERTKKEGSARLRE